MMAVFMRFGSRCRSCKFEQRVIEGRPGAAATIIDHGVIQEDRLGTDNHEVSVQNFVNYPHRLGCVPVNLLPSSFQSILLFLNGVWCIQNNFNKQVVNTIIINQGEIVVGWCA